VSLPFEYSDCSPEVAHATPAVAHMALVGLFVFVRRVIFLNKRPPYTLMVFVCVLALFIVAMLLTLLITLPKLLDNL
jgi:hypothetical protein